MAPHDGPGAVAGIGCRRSSLQFKPTMKSALWSFCGLLICAGFSRAQDVLPPAEVPHYRVQYPPSDQPGELIYGVSYTVWIPPDVKTVRGVIVHQHGCGEGACRGGQTAAHDWHWQALARRHGCALLGPSYEQPEGADCGLWCDPRNGSDARFRQALDDLAEQSGHPELRTVPWALWGHSGGGVWAGTMLMLHPQRTIAVWLRSGTPRMVAESGSALPSMEVPAAALGVPVMANLGTQEGVTIKDGRFAGVWEKNRVFFETLRSQGGLIGLAVDPHSSHDCGNSRYLAIPWFDACLAVRLPAEASSDLKPMPESTAWLAEILTPEISPKAAFRGDPLTAVWLPNEAVAHAYAEYVRDGNVVDTTAPESPSGVRIRGATMTWEANADLESGIAGFVIERDGVEVTRVPQQSARNIGRPILQRTSYHDTPTPPLASMQYQSPELADAAPASYAVRTINSVGLMSPPASAIRN